MEDSLESKHVVKFNPIINLNPNRGFKIICHNVRAWTWDRRQELTNYYNKENADIVLLNSTGIRDPGRIKLFTYNVYKRNINNEDHAGIAIAVKQNIRHRILDDFQDDILAIEVYTPRGPIIIATYYQPPRRNYISIQDVASLMRKNIPVYLLGDMNAAIRRTNSTHFFFFKVA